MSIITLISTEQRIEETKSSKRVRPGMLTIYACLKILFANVFELKLLSFSFKGASPAVKAIMILHVILYSRQKMHNKLTRAILMVRKTSVIL